jgi:hypothetical protein
MAVANRPGRGRHPDTVFLPVWCLLVVLGLLIGRKAGLRVTGGKRVAQRKA